ncbi:MAG: serine/threonine protein kinase [Myxococcaceae bacterium]|nr:serine/threonine protein kinase [Myxococcaceae bacterium]
MIGRYVIYEAIASGGQASVHYGRLSGAEGFGRTVAIKRVKASADGAEEALKALVDEARLASRISHPNVVQTLDLIEHERELLVVMEYVPGETVAKLLKAAAAKHEAVPADIAAAIVVGALRGLEAAHTATDESGARLQIIHRDISPQNIIVDVHGHARVLDFGIAKAPQRGQDTTETGNVKGKPSYMAPEQLRGKASVRTDLWACGTVLWEMLTGKKLFSGKTDEEIITKVITEAAPAPSTLVPTVPPELDAVVLKALQQLAEDRYGSAQEMLADLDKLPLAPPSRIAGWMQGLAGKRLEASAQRVRELQSSGIGRGAPKPATRSSLPVFAAVAALLVAGTATGLVLLSPRQKAPDIIPIPVPVPAPTPVVVREPEPEPEPEPAPAPPPVPEARAPKKKKPCVKRLKEYLDADGRTRYRKECI